MHGGKVINAGTGADACRTLCAQADYANNLLAERTSLQQPDQHFQTEQVVHMTRPCLNEPSPALPPQ